MPNMTPSVSQPKLLTLLPTAKVSIRTRSVLDTGQRTAAQAPHPTDSPQTDPSEKIVP